MTPVPSKGRPKEIVRLSEETVAALAERAKTEGVTKSDIMRRAIERELSGEPCADNRATNEEAQRHKDERDGSRERQRRPC